MPRQNRVLPTGEIVADPARGTLMGNRGILHGPDGRLGGARWRHRAWIACELEFRGRRRSVMAPHSYTELFFLDEAVALAAGHRPCAECRRADYRAFLDAWALASGERPRAAQLDRALHAARLDGRAQRRHNAPLASLPAGAFILAAERPALLTTDCLRAFGPGRYDVKPVAVPDPPAAVSADHLEVVVLTPEPIVQVLRAGYRPRLHPTAHPRSA